LSEPREQADETPESAAASDRETWQLIRVGSDGSLGARYEIAGDMTEIGRAGGQVEEPDDEHMADHHASLVRESGEFFIVDSGHGSGVWLRVDSPDGVELENEDQVWLGAQILVAAKLETSWTVVHYGSDGLVRETYVIGEAGIFVGRGSEYALDPSDDLLSRRHAQLCVENGKLKIYDRGARNGTYVKVSGAVAIESGAEFRISTKGYRLERVGELSPSAVAGSESQDDAALQRGGEVELQDANHPRNFPVAAGHTILQGFIEDRGSEGEPLAWECQAGTCGLCAVEVLSGSDNVVPRAATPEEKRVIETTLGTGSETSGLRLACLARVQGRIVLRARS